MNITLYSSFPDATFALEALRALRDQGASVRDLTAFFPESRQVQEAKTSQVNTSPLELDGPFLRAEVRLRTDVSTTLTSLLIPGLGTASGGGAVLASLRGLAETTLALAATRGIASLLEMAGVDSQLARKTEKALQRGSSVVLVDCPTGTLVDIRVREILLRHRASLVSRSASERMQLVCQNI